MREIKFRVWDKNEHKWMDEDWVINQSIWQLDATESRYLWLQYTGLTDKNSKEIYEGDIVTFAPHQLPFKVRWSAGAFHLVEPHSRTTYLAGAPSGLPTVIGNIYENPDLLKEAA